MFLGPAIHVVASSKSHFQHNGFFVDVSGPWYQQNHIEAQHLSCNLWLCWCLRAVLPPCPCSSRWPVLPDEVMVLSWSRLLLWVMSGGMIQKQTGSVLMSVTPGATVGCPESRRPPETMLVSKDLVAAWGILIWVASSSIFFFEIYSQMCAGPSLVDLSFISHRVRTCKEARKALWYGNLATHFLLNLTPLHIICSCEKSPIKQMNFLSSKSA